MTTSPATPLTAHRHKERLHSDRAELYALIDRTMSGTISCVVDGAPWALPYLIACVDDAIVVHGSTGAGVLRHLATGVPAVVSVFELNALIFATGLFNTSANYSGAVITGSFERLEGDAKRAAIRGLCERITPGRVAETPEPTAAEWAQTIALRLPITDDNWTAKARTGGPGECDPSPTAPWHGVLPIRQVFGDPEQVEGTDPGAQVPAAFTELRRRHQG